MDNKMPSDPNRPVDQIYCATLICIGVCVLVVAGVEALAQHKPIIFAVGLVAAGACTAGVLKERRG